MIKVCLLSLNYEMAAFVLGENVAINNNNKTESDISDLESLSERGNEKRHYKKDSRYKDNNNVYI